MHLRIDDARSPARCEPSGKRLKFELSDREKQFFIESAFGSLGLMFWGVGLITLSLAFFSPELTMALLGLSAQANLYLFATLTALFAIMGGVCFTLMTLIDPKRHLEEEARERYHRAQKRDHPSALISLCSNLAIALIASLLCGPTLLTLVFDRPEEFVGEDAPIDMIALSMTWDGSLTGKLLILALLFGPGLLTFFILIMIHRNQDDELLVALPKRALTLSSERRQALRARRAQARREAERLKHQAGGLSVAPDEGALQGGLSETE